jgi:hypothetical protein
VPLLHTQHAFPLLTESQPLVQPAQIFLRQGVMELSKYGCECGNGGLIGRTAIVDPTVLSQSSIFRQNPKFRSQEFNDLQLPNSGKSNFATEPAVERRTVDLAAGLAR